MPSYDASISIDASGESVWRVLAAVVTWPEWLPTVTGVRPLDGAALKVGSRYAVNQPKLRPTTWIVTELEPPNRLRVLGELRSTGGSKFGALVGDNCRIGANAVVAPGALLDPSTVVRRTQLLDQELGPEKDAG